MKHDFIDKYCHLDSVLHRLDPRTKLLSTFLLLVLFVASHQIKLFLLYYAMLAGLVVLSKVPLIYYLKRALLITPFVVLISIFMLASLLFFPGENISITQLTQHPTTLKVALIVLKSFASIILLTLLTSVTRFNCILWALRKFKFPPVITILSRLIYTYVFLLVDELHKSMIAIHSKAPVLRMPRTKVFGNLAASILLKSIHRSRMVYLAMESRQFSGEFPEGASNHFGLNDVAALLCCLLVLPAVYVLWMK